MNLKLEPPCQGARGNRAGSCSKGTGPEACAVMYRNRKFPSCGVGLASGPKRNESEPVLEASLITSSEIKGIDALLDQKGDDAWSMCVPSARAAWPASIRGKAGLYRPVNHVHNKKLQKSSMYKLPFVQGDGDRDEANAPGSAGDRPMVNLKGCPPPEIVMVRKLSRLP